MFLRSCTQVSRASRRVSFNAETQNGQQLFAALNFFVSSINTIVNKTMEDSIMTVKQYEVSRYEVLIDDSATYLWIWRVEYDAYRSDLDYYREAPKTEVNQMKLGETESSFNAKKTEFEKLRSDVQIKLKFLDENRVGYITKKDSKR